jgi:hypothetical protein
VRDQRGEACRNEERGVAVPRPSGTRYRLGSADFVKLAHVPVVGYYNGTWTTDGRRALTLHDCKAAETHAALMRDRCPRNADVIKVEEVAAED